MGIPEQENNGVWAVYVASVFFFGCKPTVEIG